LLASRGRSRERVKTEMSPEEHEDHISMSELELGGSADAHGLSTMIARLVPVLECGLSPRSTRVTRGRAVDAPRSLRSWVRINIQLPAHRVRTGTRGAVSPGKPSIPRMRAADVASPDSLRSQRTRSQR
jgi:hypothetical protein